MRTRTMLSLLAAAWVGLSLPAGAQPGDDRTVRVTVLPGALPDKEAIKVDQLRLEFQPGRSGRITWIIETNGYEFDNDGGRLGILLSEVAKETDPPSSQRGRADAEFTCALVPGTNGRRIRCDNKHTVRGIYYYDIRLKETATGRKRFYDPIIFNL